jgi:uncharacterized protein YecE (DUF72 family)
VARPGAAGFRYAVKANRFLTHNKKLKDVGEPLAGFIGGVRGLGETLGPILYQLPPRWHFNGDRLREFAALLPRDIVHVLEFREPSWMDPDALALLDALGLAFCTHDMIGMTVPRVATGPLAYVRFHGSGGNIGGATTRTCCAVGPTGWSPKPRAAAKSGPISTTTFTPTPSRMRWRCAG